MSSENNDKGSENKGNDNDNKGEDSTKGSEFERMIGGLYK